MSRVLILSLLLVFLVTSCTPASQYDKSMRQGKDLLKRAESLIEEATTAEEFDKAINLFEESKGAFHDAYIEEPTKKDSELLIKLANRYINKANEIHPVKVCREKKKEYYDILDEFNNTDENEIGGSYTLGYGRAKFNKKKSLKSSLDDLEVWFKENSKCAKQ
jgi:hypothetical protein